MSFMVNIDQVPVGQSYYTVYVTWDKPGTARSAMCTEEVDLVMRSTNAWGTVATYVASSMAAGYEPGYRVVGVVNQSDGYVMYDAFKAGDETGADDL